MTTIARLLSQLLKATVVQKVLTISQLCQSVQCLVSIPRPRWAPNFGRRRSWFIPRAIPAFNSCLASQAESKPSYGYNFQKMTSKMT